MKTKSLVTVVAILLTAIVYAQNKTTFGVRAGVNFQNLNGKDENDNDLDNKLKAGFNAGVNAEIPVGIDFYLQPGVLFSTKGAKYESDAKINFSYVEVPVNFIYKPELGTGRLILGFGPYAAYAIDGKFKPENGDDIDIKFENEISPQEVLTGNIYAKRFDAGGNLLFGYEWANKFSAQLNAQLGLVNINTDIEGVNTDAKTKNTGFGVSLGYRF